MRPFTLIEKSEAANFEEADAAEKAFKELANQGVVAVIGPASSAGLMRITEMANEERIAVISPTASSPEINREGGDFIFRVYPSDTSEAQTLANTIFNKCRLQKLLVVRTLDTYGEGISMEILRFGRQLSDQIPNYVLKFKPGVSEAELTTLVDRIVEEDPDAVFVGGYLNNTLSLIKEIKRRQELEKAYLFTSSAFIPNLALKELSPEFLENVMFTTYEWGVGAAEANRATFEKEFLETFKFQPNLFAAAGYDSLKILVTALNGVNTSLPDEVKGALNKITYHGLLGETDFNKRGDVTRIPKMMKMTNGAAVELTEEDMAAIKREYLTRLD
jgi:branched-chain amino acid transport system substrate-binding protein